MSFQQNSARNVNLTGATATSPPSTRVVMMGPDGKVTSPRSRSSHGAAPPLPDPSIVVQATTPRSHALGNHRQSGASAVNETISPRKDLVRSESDRTLNTAREPSPQISESATTSMRKTPASSSWFRKCDTAASDEHDYMYKVIVLGDSGAGKTSLIARLCGDCFLENTKATTGMDIKYFMWCKRWTHSETLPARVKLAIWDTCGSERFRSITQTYFRGADAIVLVYDMSNKQSFASLTSWLNMAKESGEKSEPALMVIGNKDDSGVARIISMEDGKQFAKKIGACFFETSARDFKFVEEAFVALAEEVHQRGKLHETSHIEKCEELFPTRSSRSRSRAKGTGPPPPVIIQAPVSKDGYTYGSNPNGGDPIKLVSVNGVNAANTEDGIEEDDSGNCAC